MSSRPTSADQPSSNSADEVAVAKLEQALSAMSWPADRVKVSELIARRPDLASLPLAGPRLAAGVAESV